MECKYEVFGTPSYKHAVQFCGGDDKFGLIHHFRKSERQLYYSNYAMETNGEPEKDPAKYALSRGEALIIPACASKVTVIPDTGGCTLLEAFLRERKEHDSYVDD